MLKYFLFYRALLRLLLENLNDEAGTTRALVFGVLTEMLKQETLIASFQGFTELIILKVLESHRDPEKDVSDKNEFYVQKASTSVGGFMTNLRKLLLFFMS